MNEPCLRVIPRGFVGLALRLVACIAAGTAMVASGEKPHSAATKSAKGSPSTGITISVLDAARQKPIPSFRILAGIKAGPSKEAKKPTGEENSIWLPHTLRVGSKGGYFWPRAQCYEEMRLRVEADGYQPQMSDWIKRSDLPERLVFALALDAGVNGRVLQPDGTPAASATVALDVGLRNVIVEHGRIRSVPDTGSDWWRRHVLVKADKEGRFRLPTATDASAAVLVAHDTGVYESAFDALRKQPRITLSRWGRIEGSILWKDKPGAKEPVSLAIYREQYGISGDPISSARTRSDAQGRFVFDKVLPGRAFVTREIAVPGDTFPTDQAAEGNEADEQFFSYEGMDRLVEVRSGEPTPVLIGGRGRTVRARFIGEAPWKDLTFRLHPTAPPFLIVSGEPAGGGPMWMGWHLFERSPIGQLFFRWKLKPNADGSFELRDMLPGKYQMFIDGPWIVTGVGITVDPEKPGEDPPPQDVGDLNVRPDDDTNERKQRGAASEKRPNSNEREQFATRRKHEMLELMRANDAQFDNVRVEYDFTQYSRRESMDFKFRENLPSPFRLEISPGVDRSGMPDANTLATWFIWYVRPGAKAPEPPPDKKKWVDLMRAKKIRIDFKSASIQTVPLEVHTPEESETFEITRTRAVLGLRWPDMAEEHHPPNPKLMWKWALIGQNMQSLSADLDRPGGKREWVYLKTPQTASFNSYHEVALWFKFALGIGYAERVKNATEWQHKGDLTAFSADIQIWPGTIDKARLEIDRFLIVRTAKIDLGNTQITVETQGTYKPNAEFRCAQQGSFQRMFTNTDKPASKFDIRLRSIGFNISDKEFDRLLDMSSPPGEPRYDTSSRVSKMR